MISDIVARSFAEFCTNLMHEPMPILLQDTNGAPNPWPLLKGSILYKKGDRNDIRNYRPLSIMDTDLRWRAKVMLNRMMPVLNTTLSEEQTGFLKGRTSLDNILTLLLMIEHAKATGEEAIAITLDQEKAYDRVNWDWMFQILKHMNFPEFWISAIKHSYTRPAVQFIFEEERTARIKHKCGILQGGLLSVVLFLLTLQPLLSVLNNEGYKITIEFEGDIAELTTMAFADDILLIIPNKGKLREIWDILEKFGRLSNFPPPKSLGLILKTNRENNADRPWYEGTLSQLSIQPSE
jgi:Reverse transcriptase (RNA-dependent DNA polymerase)